jgi:hypothetical protein
MSRNYQSSDEFRREDQRLCRQIDARAERMAAERVRDVAPSLLASLKTAVKLFENDDECDETGSDAWLWLTIARQIIDRAEGRIA